MLKQKRFFRYLIFGGYLFLSFGAMLPLHAGESKITFEISAREGLISRLPASGRLFVMLSRGATREPRFGVGWAGPGAQPFFAKDVSHWDSHTPLTFADEAMGFPVERLSQLSPGQYIAQALFDVDTTFSYLNAPGNFYSTPIQININGTGTQHFRLVLDHQIPPEKLPADTKFVKYVRMRSERLSKFWGRPVYLRAAVVLPAQYYNQPQRRFPVRYHIGGYHARYTAVQRMMREGSAFRKMWFSPQCPQMILVHLDGEAPYGDSYQCNSANNGPYGDATVRELIPYIEKTYRAMGEPGARFVDGGSTGGWASLALQIFYPDDFNGVWSFCADGVDFRYFQLVNIYQDDNAFVNEYGYERPSMRDTDGEPRFSIRREIAMERVMGRGNTFATSGGQWGGWNAVYSPRGGNGRPLEIWNSLTGKIDHRVARAWEKYDLRKVLQQSWHRLGPELQGKLHIWMGDMDSFYLNNAMRLMEKFLHSTKDPTSDAKIFFSPGKGHCWKGISDLNMMQQMVDRAATLN